MTLAVFAFLGLAFGSFVNALVWRLYKQEEKGKTKTKIKGKNVDLSISKGRSVCVHCGHELAAKDLIPVLSWLSLGGKCRYCKKPIEDTPLTELLTSAAFAVSYVWWPFELVSTSDWAVFTAWLVMVIGLVALTVYDLRHMILPNKIVFPLMGLAVVMRVLMWSQGDSSFTDELIDSVAGVLVGGGLFYVLFQVSGGRWIGGGDVKLGFLIGILLGPMNALVALLVGFYSAAIIILPLMATKKVTRKSKIPFGPFLILGFFTAMLWADDLREFYNSIFGL